MPAESIQLFDRTPIPAGLRKDAAGNLIALDATVAKTGIYKYAGYELGKPDVPVIRVLRPAEEVFNRDTMRSLAGVPVTIRHPRELVDTTNWKEHAKGETSDDDIVRDGELVKVPFIVRDAGAISAVEDGLHELSPGYTALIDWTAGQTSDGQEYDAIARNIRYNHLAIVDRARGGSSCRIGDEEPKEIKVSDLKMILIDGLSVETTEAGERAILKLQGERDDARAKLTDAEKATVAANDKASKLEGEKAALDAQLKDATNPEALSAAAAARSKLIEDAKKIDAKIVTDGKSDAEIRKSVVSAKLGDAAKDFDDTAIAGAFATLVATAPTKSGNDKIVDSLRTTHVSDSDNDDVKTLLDARDKARDKMFNRFETASQSASRPADKE